MKKLGFTLTEVLLSMAIIGIVASITAPSLINVMPNKDKMQTLKYQKTTTAERSLKTARKRSLILFSTQREATPCALSI